MSTLDAGQAAYEARWAGFTLGLNGAAPAWADLPAAGRQVWERIEEAVRGAAPASFQARVQPWMMACFGEEIAGDREERNHRFLEEALELVQACGCTRSEAHQLVDYTFGRPAGEPSQEVGGVEVTLAALCLANGLDMHAAAEAELARVWMKVDKIRAKQAAKPKFSPLPEAVEPTRRLYLDLDGVMADFDAHFPAVFGLDHRGMADDAMWKTINAHPSYFRDMPPCAGAIAFFRSIEHLRPIILTACPRTNYPHVARQKRAWVREHLSEHVTVLPVLGGRNKPLFMQEPGDVLIDDWGRNTEAWEKAGGVAILHRDFEATAAALVGLFPAAPAAPAAEPDAGALERVRHLKSDTEYEVLGEAEAQVSVAVDYMRMDMPARLVWDGNRIIVYRCVETGKLWFRFTDEFRDGRFETVSPTPRPDPTPHLAEVERLRAAIEAEAEALDETAAKVRAGSSGDKVAAWIEMSARGLRAALSAAQGDQPAGDAS